MTKERAKDLPSVLKPGEHVHTWAQYEGEWPDPHPNRATCRICWVTFEWGVVNEWREGTEYGWRVVAK